MKPINQSEEEKNKKKQEKFCFRKNKNKLKEQHKYEAWVERPTKADASVGSKRTEVTSGGVTCKS